MAGYVERGEVRGVVTQVSRRGELHVDAIGMQDTGFSVPAAQLARLARSYWTDPETGVLDLYDEAEGGQWSRPPAFPSGAGGLVSTIDDFLVKPSTSSGLLSSTYTMRERHAPP